MEKAVLKTLIYADLFEYPLKINEIHKWLIGKKINLRQVEKVLEKLSREGKISKEKGYFCLNKKGSLIRKRRFKEEYSRIYFKKAKLLSNILKIIPWIKLVGISGGLAMNNASKKDDIDFFIITSKKRLWLSRLLSIIILSLLDQRRKVNDKKVAGKICLNILIEEDRLEQVNKDIYTAHEVLQMKVLWEKDGIYSKYLLDNEWVFRFLQNWVGEKVRSSKIKKSQSSSLKIIDYLEYFSKRFQLMIMKKPKGMERIEEGSLYFHPEDYRHKILAEFKRRTKNLN